MKKIYLILFVFFSSLVACKKDAAVFTDVSPALTPYVFNIPAGLPPIHIPADNPMSVEGVALGKKLFYDNILSGNGTMNCGSCHHQNYAFADTGRFSYGIDGIHGTRSAMPLFNVAYAQQFFWDGGAASLEDQVIGPIKNPIELHADLQTVISKLNADAYYSNAFKKVFGSSPITTSQLMKAIAQFERTILSGDSKFDLYLRGQATLTASEQRGLVLYTSETGDCFHCHSVGSTMTDFAYKNNGLDSIPADSGRYRITLNNADIGKFKTPSLRNIALTAPYMHDGRFRTLEDVVNFYNTGFHKPLSADPLIIKRKYNQLSAQDVADIVALLKTFTDNSLATNSNYSK